MERILFTSLAWVALGLAGCAASGPAAEQREAQAAAQAQTRQEALDDILSTPLSAEEYSGAQERCLSSFAYRSIDVLDDQHVVFKGSGDRLWLNKLRTRCIGLRPDEILQFDLRNNRVCDLDSFRAVDRLMNSGRTSGTCTLGKFTPLSPEQMEAIELAFKESRDSGS